MKIIINNSGLWNSAVYIVQMLVSFKLICLMHKIRIKGMEKDK